jgi:hypothetical protein
MRGVGGMPNRVPHGRRKILASPSGPLVWYRYSEYRVAKLLDQERGPAAYGRPKSEKTPEDGRLDGQDIIS